MKDKNGGRLTDAELMEALVRRDADAMAAIYARYESTLWAVILSVLHEESESDDVLHDVFIQLWNYADRFIARAFTDFWLLWPGAGLSIVCVVG
jgi:RNA polymerase sigma-70 factor, ECF subfamily